MTAEKKPLDLVALRALVQRRTHRPLCVAKLCSCDACDAERELRSDVPALIAEVESMRTERDALRKAVIASGREAGAFLDDSVSSAFLACVPGEVRLVIADLRARNARLEKALHECLRIATEDDNTLESWNAVTVAAESGFAEFDAEKS